MNGEFGEQNDSVISADVLLQAAGFMNDSLREKVHAELAPCTNDQFVQRYCQLDPSFADTMYGEFNIDVSDIHQEKNIEAMLSPVERAKNELRDALLSDEKSLSRCSRSMATIAPLNISISSSRLSRSLSRRTGVMRHSKFRPKILIEMPNSIDSIH